MKKNVMMRLASFLLVAVLISTSAISGTYAKYVTSTSTSNTARVAKWGIVLTVENGESVFSKEYTGTAGKTTVISSTEDKVVAPGTKNEEGVTFTLAGTPEVAFKLTAGLKDTNGNSVQDIFLKKGNGYIDYTVAPNGTFDLGEDYYPVVFTLVHTYKDGGWPILTGEDQVKNSDDSPYVGTNIFNVTHDGANKTVTVKGTLTDINAVLAQVSKNMSHVNPNYKLDDTFTLTWEWKFEQGTTPTDDTTMLYDKADTLLGNLAANEAKYAGTLVKGTDYNLNLNYNFSITVEQVD